MNSKDRLTAQGIRDLNYYGPRRVPAAATTPESPSLEPAPLPATTIATEAPLPAAD